MISKLQHFIQDQTDLPLKLNYMLRNMNILSSKFKIIDIRLIA